jgi:hypothetical protein
MLIEETVHSPAYRLPTGSSETAGAIFHIYGHPHADRFHEESIGLRSNLEFLCQEKVVTPMVLQFFLETLQTHAVSSEDIGHDRKLSKEAREEGARYQAKKSLETFYRMIQNETIDQEYLNWYQETFLSWLKQDDEDEMYELAVSNENPSERIDVLVALAFPKKQTREQSLYHGVFGLENIDRVAYILLLNQITPLNISRLLGVSMEKLFTEKDYRAVVSAAKNLHPNHAESTAWNSAGQLLAAA